MALFETFQYHITISSAFARQRFLCSAEYCGGVCHGACCKGETIVLLTRQEAKDLKAKDRGLPIQGRVLMVHGRCPLLLPNGHCKYHGTNLKPFVCNTLPFRLNKQHKLILDNRWMQRKCRVRQRCDGGQPAYKAFRSAFIQIFGERLSEFIESHFDNGGGDITIPVPKESMEVLIWQRKVINDILRFGYTETVEKLSGGK